MRGRAWRRQAMAAPRFRSKRTAANGGYWRQRCVWRVRGIGVTTHGARHLRVVSLARISVKRLASRAAWRVARTARTAFAGICGVAAQQRVTRAANRHLSVRGDAFSLLLSALRGARADSAARRGAANLARIGRRGRRGPLRMNIKRGGRGVDAVWRGAGAFVTAAVSLARSTARGKMATGGRGKDGDGGGFAATSAPV